MRLEETKITYEFRLKERITGNYGETIKSRGSLIKSIPEKKYINGGWKLARPDDTLTKIAIAHGFWSSIKVEDCNLYKVTTIIKREKQ